MGTSVSRAGYIVRPSAAAAGGVFALHAWWGLNDCFRAMCDQIAAEGYLVVAPDMYDGDVATTSEEALALRSRRRQAPVYKGLLNGLERLAAETGAQSQVAMLGLSMGGHWALWLAAREDVPACATVLYYASRACDFSRSRSAFQFHFAETDPFVSAASRKRLTRALADAGRPAETHEYPGTYHWFAERDRPEFEPASAGLAWERTLRFLHTSLDAPRQENS
jgi:carboxymethylenebutenolidase